MMTQNNLALIENQLIPEGYKKTEVGIIPNDWNIESLQNLCRSSITYGIVQCGPHIPNGIPYIRVSDMNSSELNVDEMLRTSPEIASSFGRSKVEEGDIVYALRGKLGEVKMVGTAVAGANLTQGTARIAPNNNIDNRYLLWALRSPQALKQAIKEAKGSTFVEITLGNLKGITVPLPSSKEEQQKIAVALSDTDALISELEKLIEKKQAIKTATMQQLLTGKTRLPEFALREDGTPKDHKDSELGQIPEDWEVVPFRECIDIPQGQVNPINEPYASMILVGPKHIESGTGKLLFEETASEQQAISGKYLFEEGDVLYGKINPYLMKATLVDFKGLCSADMYPLRPKDNIKPGLLLALILGEDFTKYAVSVSARSGMPKINRNELAQYKFCLPNNLEEQEKIANILLSLDESLESLNIHLNKIYDIKKGMMQELLTGKTRLV